MMYAKISEIFSSIQGEGLYVGQPQVFVRFFGCNMLCKFCDESRKRRFKEYSLDEVVSQVIEAGQKTVSLTGGEPLLQCDFLTELLPILKQQGLSICLETNGILKDELSRIIKFVDIISMDMKLPSSTGMRPYWAEHRAFLKEAKFKCKNLFVKAVVTNNTTKNDIKRAAFIIKDIDQNISFIIQPVSYNNRVEKIDLIQTFLDIARRHLLDVRVIPQIHKILGVK